MSKISQNMFHLVENLNFYELSEFFLYKITRPSKAKTGASDVILGVCSAAALWSNLSHLNKLVVMEMFALFSWQKQVFSTGKNPL